MATRIKGLKELESFIRRFPKSAQRGAMRGITKGALRVQRQARVNLKPWRQGGGLDRGQLRQSVGVLVQMVGLGVIGVIGTNKSYGPAIHFGTPPHDPGDISTWERRHGIAPGVMRAAIQKKGTIARPFLADAFKKKRRAAIKDVVAEIGKEINRAKSR